MTNQQKQIDAQAVLRVNEALSSLALLQHRSVSHMAMNVGAWSVNGVPDMSVPKISSDDIGLGYPERAEEIADAFRAAERLNAIYQRYLTDPWPVQFPGDEQAKIDAAPRMEEAQNAVRAFGDAFVKVRDIADL
jgi:hypothetical protein